MMRNRYRVKITPSGYVYILITIVLSVGAANTGNNLLYLMTSLMLALMAMSGFISFMNFFFLEISVTPPGEIFAGTPAPFKLHFHKKRGYSFFLRCDTIFGAVKCPIIRGEMTSSIWLNFSQRGIGRIEDVRIDSGFPLGFFYRSKWVPVNVDVLVFPKPLPGIFPALAGTAHGTGKSILLQGEWSDETKELRTYRPTDPLKWIDWKATARKGKPVSRDFYHIEGDTLLIDLSEKKKDWEKRLSEACSLVLECDHRRLFSAMILPDREIAPGKGQRHKRHLLEALALA